jgi:hypothetical protein
MAAAGGMSYSGAGRGSAAAAGLPTPAPRCQPAGAWAQHPCLHTQLRGQPSHVHEADGWAGVLPAGQLPGGGPLAGRHQVSGLPCACACGPAQQHRQREQRLWAVRMQCSHGAWFWLTGRVLEVAGSGIGLCQVSGPSAGAVVAAGRCSTPP